MPVKYMRGYQEKQVYKNERYNKGTVSTNDPLYEGSFRRLINFNVSNQNASIENREPFLTVPLYDLQNKEIILNKNTIVFSLNQDTEHAYILDLNQNEVLDNMYQSIFLKRNVVFQINRDFVIDGDTFEYEKERYRLALIDSPELSDDFYEPLNPSASITNMGLEAKQYATNFFELTPGDAIHIIQFPFQSEKIDEFGRKIVYVIKINNNEITFLNIKLLENGISSFLDSNSNKGLILNLNIPNKVFIEDNEIDFASIIENAYKDPFENKNFMYGSKYTDVSVRISSYDINSNLLYTKPLIHKIKKETDLKITEDRNILKRVLKTFEINELYVKRDLEIFNDESLKYEFIQKDFSVLNTKYGDQSMVFLVNVINQFGINLYRGLIEITYNLPDYDNGIYENFFLKTYKKPETQIEIQDLTNMKPNIYDENSFIPETLIGVKSNVRGYTSPSVDVVLLSTNLNDNLERPKTNDERTSIKYFNTNGPIFEDIRRYNLYPIFKAPILSNTRKNKYMFRWDFVDLTEIDSSNEEEVRNAKPFFRTAWTELVDNPREINNISHNLNRRKKLSTNIRNLRTADEYYIIRSSKGFLDLFNNEIPNIEEMKDQDDITIQDLQKLFKDFIESTELDDIKKYFKEGTEFDGSFELSDTDAGIENYKFEFYKVKDKLEILKTLSSNQLKDSLEFEELTSRIGKPLSKEERMSIFDNEDNQDKIICFIFAPLGYVLKNTDGQDRIINFAFETTGITFKESHDRKQVIPFNVNFDELYRMTIRSDNPIDLDFFDFFKNGIQATFYLYNYESIEMLTENDEFYDNIAYKKTTATYTFRKGNINKYNIEDFIDDKLDKESFAVKYSNYLTKYEDRILVYGNPRFKNTVFMSEDGAPYYFTLLNTFEFDHEVVHIQTFKNIILVFTINDIWVIYPWQEQSVFEGITTVINTFRIKKVLYNVSTEVKNKVTIKNITKYITLMSNNVLYLIRPSTYISDETEFNLTILSQNIDAVVKDPLKFINERLKYHQIQESAIDYEINLNATDNYIKLYYSTKIVDNKGIEYKENWYNLILTYDILNNRWFEEDTISFGKIHQIYLLDSTTKYEMLTEMNDKLYITYQTDKYKNYMLDKNNESYYDKNPFNNYSIKYFIDTGYLKLNEHLKKRFKFLQVTMKNIDSKDIYFSYNFTVDDNQFYSNFEPTYTVNKNNQIIEVIKLKEDLIEEPLKNIDRNISKIGNLISNIGRLDNFILDFSNLESGDIITIKQNLLGKGRLPRVQMGFTSKNRFYILSFGIIYSEHGGR